MTQITELPGNTNPANAKVLEIQTDSLNGISEKTTKQQFLSNIQGQLDSHEADSGIHYVVGSIDHGAILNVGTNSHAAIDTHIGTSNIHFTVASIDHGSITGLAGDDHTQYHNDARGDVRYYTKAEVDAAIAAAVADYLPLAGGRMTGNLEVQGTIDATGDVGGFQTLP
jgi:hypothetical protein